MAQEDTEVGLQKKCEEYLNNWKRAQADFENYKKGEIERAKMLVEYAREDVVSNLLPILDSIYLMEKHGQVEGIDVIKKQIEEFLRKEGIEEVKVLGEMFNPETMEVVEEVESAAAEGSGAVKEELQKGYTVNGKVIRPAKVKISK